MVHVATPRPSIGGALGQALGAYGGNEFSYQRNRQRTLDALQQARQNASQANTPSDLLFSLLEATAGRPGAEKSLGPLFQHLLPQLQARGSQNVQYTPDERTQLRDQEQPIDRAQNQQLPSFANLSQNNEFFPSNQPPGEGPGNVPQAATGGIKRPVLDAKQLIAEGKRISKQQTDEGIPTNVKQGYDLAKEINDETKIYNEQIDAELAQRVKSQQQYGQRSEEQLLKLFPEATGEQRAIFKKKGEQIARGSETQSEADIDRHIAKEATKFKNTISNIEKDMSAPRSQNLLQRKFLGTEKDFESASNDLRVKLKPLLDDGLYDTARSLLQRLGYAPEERESVVNPLTERAQRTIKLVPNAQKVTQKRIPGGATGGGGIPIIQVPTLEYSPRAKEDLKSNLQDVFNADPNASLVLVRKGFEDKGYDWRIFRDGLNDLLQTPPDQGGIQLNDDQQAQIQHLDSPPLNALEKILHGLKIIGR